MLGQIVIDSANAAAEAAASSQESISLLELVMKGGVVMILLFLLSVVAIYIFAERFLTIMKASRDPDEFMDEIRTHVLEGNINDARMICQREKSPFSRMIDKGISRIGNSLENISESIENVGKIELFKLEKNLSTLATISGAAPMIGFFGTVIGMIRAFMGMAESDAMVSPQTLSSGIYEAMITTAGGLLVGIMAYIGYNYLVSKVEKTVHNMEAVSIEFVDLLQEPQN